jgi:pimeloyl-ACP methyl ester carboxylesterase
MRRFFSAAVQCALVTLATSIPALGAPRDLPIIFVHGWCSGSTTWDDMINLLRDRDPDRYGRRVVRMYSNGSGVFALNDARRPSELLLRLTSDPNLAFVKTFTVDFFNVPLNSLDPEDVANVDIKYKAGELKRAIDRVKALTGFEAVILVAHSLGGLVGRTYVEGGAYSVQDN